MERKTINTSLATVSSVFIGGIESSMEILWLFHCRSVNSRVGLLSISQALKSNPLGVVMSMA
jgi:hypothetical protein